MIGNELMENIINKISKFNDINIKNKTSPANARTIMVSNSFSLPCVFVLVLFSIASPKTTYK